MINPENKRVLALMPHPDDIEFQCAGTLTALREQGYEIHMATMTAGDKGSALHTSEEIAAIRRNEAREAAEVLGAASYRCLEFRDLEICFDNPSRRRVTSVVREIAPFLIFTTPPADYIFDHEITAQLVRDACFNASCPLYHCDTPGASEEVPYLYYSCAVEGHDIWGQPSNVTNVVDVTPYMELKSKALACHDSQRSWLQTQHGIDNYMETMKRWSRKQGERIGVEYAESFTQHLGHPHPQDDILGQLLSGKSES